MTLPTPESTPVLPLPEGVLATVLDYVSGCLSTPWYPLEMRMVDFGALNLPMPDAVRQSVWLAVKEQMTNKGWPVHNEYAGTLKWLTYRGKVPEWMATT